VLVVAQHSGLNTAVAMVVPVTGYRPLATAVIMHPVGTQ
jgi:hypothetical protein